MERLPIIALATFLQCATAVLSLSGVRAGELQMYKHPKLDFRFFASAGWESYPRPEDDLIYEMFEREAGIHVMLWYTATEQDARGYLRKMADMMSVVCDTREPQHREIAGRKAWAYSVSAEIRRQAVHTILAVIDGGPHDELRNHNALYVVQVWCPAEKHPGLGVRMEEILAGVSIGSGN